MSSKGKPKIVLPPGWVVKPSSKHPDRVYYFNVYTGSSLWDPPIKNVKPSVNNKKQENMKQKDVDTQRHKFTRREPAEAARTASEPSSSKQENAFMNSLENENGMRSKKRKYEDSPSSTETSIDSEKYAQKSRALEPKVPRSVNNSTNNSTAKESFSSNEIYDPQNELLEAIFRTGSNAHYRGSDSESESTPNISKNKFSPPPLPLRKDPVHLPPHCASSSHKSDTTSGLPATKTHPPINFQRRGEKFDLRHILEDRRRTKSLLEPLSSSSVPNGYIKEEATTNSKRHSIGDAKGVAERRMQSLRDTLSAEKEANEKKALEVREKSLAPKRDVSGAFCTNIKQENEIVRRPAVGQINDGYSSSAAATEVSPPFRKRKWAKRRKKKKQRNQNIELDKYKDGGLEKFFTKDASGPERDPPSKVRRVQQPASESSTSIPSWYPKNERDPDSSFSSDLETSSLSAKNLGAKRLVQLRQTLLNGSAQQDNTELHQTSEDYEASVSPEENQYPGAEVHTDKVEAELEEEVEPMEWEPFEELSVLVQWGQDNSSTTSDTPDNKEWYIVIDTNIFVSNLKVVEELRDMNDKVLGYPVLIIPNVVLTELEGIRHRSATDRSPKGASRAAIKFINYHLRKFHPRIRAQGALNTVAVPELEIETGDDKILHCCLLLLKKTDRVILLTDDCNLRNRAKSFSIIACHHLDIQDAIQELYHCSSKPKLDALLADGTSTMLQPSQPKTAGQIEAAKVDTITCKLKSTLKDVFSKFLQAEMEAAYDDMWIKVILIKPPWTMLQVLECLRKHWIAVIAFVLPSQAKDLIDKLYNFFNEKYESHGLGHTLAEVKEILQISLKMCSLLPASKPYDDLTSLSITVIKELLEEVKEDTSRSIVAAAEVSSNNIGSNNGNEVVVKDENTSSSLPEAQGVEAVHQALDRIYLYILSFCGTMFDVLERPHDIPYSRPERLPSLTSVREAFPEVYSKLRSLLESLRGILQSSPVLLTIDHPFVQELYLSITKFFEEEVDSPVAIKGVFDFCAPDQREMLEGALSKLAQCEGMLNIGMDHIVKLVVQ